jgi:hypothetical protein
MSIGSSIVSAGIRASLKIAARWGSRAPFDPYSTAPFGRGAPEAFSKPKEEISKSQGRKFQGKGSEIQIFSFRESRLFNSLG